MNGRGYEMGRGNEYYEVSPSYPNGPSPQESIVPTHSMPRRTGQVMHGGRQTTYYDGDCAAHFFKDIGSSEPVVAITVSHHDVYDKWQTAVVRKVVFSQ